jgi:hypothetical protein
MLCGKMYRLHVLARSCRGNARDRFQEGPVRCCLGKLYKDKILLVGGRREETVALSTCLISAIQPEIVTGGLCYGAGLLGPIAELRHILDGDV